MKPALIRWLTFLLSVVALIGFIVVYYKLLSTRWTESLQPKPNFEFLASALAGLVGGIVAAAFGQKLPNPPGKALGHPPAGMRLAMKLNAFGKFVSPTDKDLPRQVLAAAYAVIYIGLSVWAIIVWARDIPYTPKLTNNLAVVSIGLFIAIITAYLNNDS